LCHTRPPYLLPPTLRLHDALPILPKKKGSIAMRLPRTCCFGSGSWRRWRCSCWLVSSRTGYSVRDSDAALRALRHDAAARLLDRSEEHTSELQSRENLLCRLLLEK